MEGSNLGKILILFGISIVIIGILFWLMGKTSLTIGKLPGDIHFESGKFSFYFPLVTSLVLSILLTIALNLLFWLFRK